MRILLCLCLSFISPLGAKPLFLEIEGYLSRATAEEAMREIDSFSDEKIVTIIRSDEGDLNAAFALGRALASWKEKNTQGDLVIYIDEKALGPAAILPFLANSLYHSNFVSWGDIHFEDEEDMPKNLLISQLTSLISPQEKQLLQTAKEMAGESDLILNRYQIDQFAISEGTLTKEAFKKQFDIEEKPPSIQTVNEEAYDLPLDKQLADAITYSPDGKNLIGYLKIDDKKTSINQGTWLYITKAIEVFKEKRPIFVILELDTPGGEVYAAQKISDALKELDTQEGIPVISFINNWAISAGAMIAYSTRFITIAKDAAMGAAEPIQQVATSQETQVASEKVNSAIRADFANRAAFFGRNPSLAEAMVDKDIILVKRDGEIVKLTNEDQIRSSDQVITQKGKLLTLSAQEMMNLGVADILLDPQKLTPITKKEQEKNRWPFSKTLLSTYPFFAKFKEAEVIGYEVDARTRFFQFLMTPMVSSLLFLGLMIGFYMELSTPGFGFAGSVGTICLILIVLSSFALEIGSWLELLLMAIGLALFLIDLFVIPSFGLLGSVGVIAFIAGLVGLMVPGLEDVDYSFDTGALNEVGMEVLRRLAWLGGALIVGLISIALLAKYVMPSFKPFRRLVSDGEQSGYSAGESSDTMPTVGKEGVVIAPLRPAGRVLIEGRNIDAMSVGSFIEKGEKVRVARIEGSRLFVRKI